MPVSQVRIFRNNYTPIMLALCLMLLGNYYAKNYAGVIGWGLCSSICVYILNIFYACVCMRACLHTCVFVCMYVCNYTTRRTYAIAILQAIDNTIEFIRSFMYISHTTWQWNSND